MHVPLVGLGHGGLVVPCILAELLFADIVAIAVTRRATGAAGVLPLGFGREAVRPAVFGGELGAERHSVVPTHMIGCVVGVLLRGALAFPRGCAHRRFPLSLRCLVNRYVESFGDLNFVLRAFLLVSAQFVIAASHHELTGRDQHKLDASGVDEGDGVAQLLRLGDLLFGHLRPRGGRGLTLGAKTAN